MPDRMSEDMPDGMPDRHARWNARQTCQMEGQTDMPDKMSEGMN